MITTSASSLRASASRSRSAAVGVCTSSTSAGAGTARLAPSSVTCAPRRRASAASADAHPSRRAVADEAHGVDRLARAARRHEDVLPLQRAAAGEQIEGGGDDLVRLRHPADAELALRRLTLVRADEDDAATSQRFRVRTRRRVRPHARVHRRRDEHRSAVRERRLGEDVVGEAVRELRERVRRARGDDEQVGARQVEVDVVAGRPAREGAKGLGGDEPLGAGRDERARRRARP